MQLWLNSSPRVISLRLHSTLTSSFYLGCHGVMIVYDQSENFGAESFHHWAENVQRHCDTHVAVVLVANKCDLVDPGTRDEHRVKIADETGGFLTTSKLLFTSAKTTEGVVEAFAALVEAIMKKASEEESQEAENEKGD